MDDEKLKQELFYMVRLTSKYDFSRMDVVEGILRLENERRILDSVFGRRFKTRIFDIAADVKNDGDCVICGQPAENKVICNHCMESILGSEYAKSKIKPENKSRFNLIFSKIKGIKIPKVDFSKLKSINLKKKEPKAVEQIVSKSKSVKQILSYVLIGFLSLILLIQLWILTLWVNLPESNPLEEPKVSINDLVPVSNKDEALAQLELDFSPEEGYILTYARTDKEYVGRFLIERGQCCEDVEEDLTDEQRYDYFFKEDVYVFYISYQADHVGKVGLAEINSAGAVLVMGSFNDGRKTDCRYKYR